MSPHHVTASRVCVSECRCRQLTGVISADTELTSSSGNTCSIYTLHAQTDYEGSDCTLSQAILSRSAFNFTPSSSWMLALFYTWSLECSEQSVGRLRNRASWMLEEDQFYCPLCLLQWESVPLSADWPCLTCPCLLLSENTLHQQDGPFMDPGEKTRGERKVGSFGRVLLFTRTIGLVRPQCSLLHRRCVPSSTWCQT